MGFSPLCLHLITKAQKNYSSDNVSKKWKANKGLQGKKIIRMTHQMASYTEKLISDIGFNGAKSFSAHAAPIQAEKSTVYHAHCPILIICSGSWNNIR